MVSFRIIASALAIAAPIAAQTSAQIVTQLNSMTTKTTTLQPIAESIVTQDAVLLLTGQGRFKQIIDGLQNFIITTSEYSANNQNNQPLIAAGADSDAVATAYSRFATSHINLMNTLTGKAGIASTIPFIGAPMAAILRQDENIIDRFNFALISAVPSRVTDIQADARNLGGALVQATKAYAGEDVIPIGGRSIPAGKRSMKFGRREIVAAA